MTMDSERDGWDTVHVRKCDAMPFDTMARRGNWGVGKDPDGRFRLYVIMNRGPMPISDFGSFDECEGFIRNAEGDGRMTRDLIVDEHEAVNEYEKLAEASSDPRAKAMYHDIAREEKVHAGELNSLLDRQDCENASAEAEGEAEAAELIPSDMRMEPFSVMVDRRITGGFPVQKRARSADKAKLTAMGKKVGNRKIDAINAEKRRKAVAEKKERGWQPEPDTYYPNSKHRKQIEDSVTRENRVAHYRNVGGRDNPNNKLHTLPKPSLSVMGTDSWNPKFTDPVTRGAENRAEPPKRPSKLELSRRDAKWTTDAIRAMRAANPEPKAYLRDPNKEKEDKSPSSARTATGNPYSGGLTEKQKEEKDKFFKQNPNLRSYDFDKSEGDVASPGGAPLEKANRPSIRDRIGDDEWFVWDDNGTGRYNGPVLKWDGVDKTKLIDAVKRTVNRDLYDEDGDGYEKALARAEKEVLDFRSGPYSFDNKAVWKQLEDFVRRCVINSLPDSMKGDRAQVEAITKKQMDGIIRQRREYNKEMAFQKKFKAYYRSQYKEVSANLLADRLFQLSKKDLERSGAAERFAQAPGDVLRIMKETGYRNEKNLSGTELLMDYFKELGKKDSKVRESFVERAKMGRNDTRKNMDVQDFLTTWGRLFNVYGQDKTLDGQNMVKETQYSSTANGLLQRLNNYLQGPETTMKSIPLPQHIAKRRTLDLLKEHSEYFGPRGNIPLGKKGRPIFLSPFDEEAQTSRTHSRYREKPKRESLKGGERFREAEEGLLDKFFTTGAGAKAGAERLTGEDAARAERYFDMKDAVDGMSNLRQGGKPFERQYGFLEKIFDKNGKDIPDVMEIPLAKPRKFSKTEFEAVEAADPSELIKYWSNYRANLHQALREAAAVGRIPKDELDSIRDEIISVENRPVEVLIEDPPSTERMDALIRNYVPDEGFEAAPTTLITRDKVSAIMDGLKSLKSDGSRNPRTDKAVDAATKILPKVLRYLMDSIKEGNESPAEEAKISDAGKAEESAEYDEQDVPEELFEDYLSDDDSEDEFEDDSEDGPEDGGPAPAENAPPKDPVSTKDKDGEGDAEEVQGVNVQDTNPQDKPPGAADAEHNPPYDLEGIEDMTRKWQDLKGQNDAAPPTENPSPTPAETTGDSGDAVQPPVVQEQDSMPNEQPAETPTPTPPEEPKKEDLAENNTAKSRSIDFPNKVHKSYDIKGFEDMMADGLGYFEGAIRDNEIFREPYRMVTLGKGKDPISMIPRHIDSKGDEGRVKKPGSK